MRLATERRPKTLSDALLRASGFHPPIYPSKERLFESWNGFTETYRKDAEGLAVVGRKYMGVDLQFAPVPILGSKIAALNYDDALHTMQEGMQEVFFRAHREFERCRAGRITCSDDGENCRFTFHEVYRRKGIFRETISRTPHEHELVRVRFRRVDDPSLTLPPIAQGIVNDLTPGLRRQLRIVVGTEVVRSVGDGEVRNELTALGRAVVGAGKEAARIGAIVVPIVGGIAAGGLVGAAAVAGVGMLASAMFVADPALVLGDVCLYGWED